MQHDRTSGLPTLKFWPLLNVSWTECSQISQIVKVFDSDTDINMEKKSEDVEKFRIAKNVRRCGFQKGHTVHTSKKDVADNSTPSMWMPRLTQAEFTRVAKVTPGGLIEVPQMLRANRVAPNS